ncbi:MAG: GDP-mannose 4,6-dehydratase [Solirubrobacterales bacterium]
MTPPTDTRRAALITGIGGQDGSYLAELLVAEGYDVAGVVLGAIDEDRPNLSAVSDQITLHNTDLTDAEAVDQLIAEFRPTEVYNLAAPSVVPASWDDPIATINFMAGSVVCLLDAILKHSPDAHFLHASSSEIFRGGGSAPQNEPTTPRPISPYGVGKLAGNGLVNSYRARHGMHASSAILYNHESPRRPLSFVPSKIVHGVAAIKAGKTDELVLGSLDSERDWGFAGDYVDAMWKIITHDQSGDYVVATGKKHSVADLVDRAFSLVDLDPAKHVRSDPRFARRGDEADLVGDPAHIAETIGWQASTSFDRLVEIMLESALEQVGEANV